MGFHQSFQFQFRKIDPSFCGGFVMPLTESHPAATGKTNWKIAAYTALIVGTIFLMATGGDPWGFSAFVRPMVMGREIIPATTEAGQFNFSYLTLHYVLSLLFVFIMAPVLSRVLITKAMFIGLLFGFLFYAANRVAFSLVDIATKTGETRVVITNVCFGLLAAAVYRGMARGGIAS
jgi:hypothetical protein